VGSFGCGAATGSAGAASRAATGSFGNTL
jgi:hypothetical protein